MNTHVTNGSCIEVCNGLLRGELSAIETYEKAIEKYPSSTITSELERICSEHRFAADFLSRNVLDMGGEPETGSGAWGAFANTVQSAANLFGEDSAISSLQRGEEHGKAAYEDALDDDDVMDSCKELIRSELLPRTTKHIAVLEALEEDGD